MCCLSNSDVLLPQQNSVTESFGELNNVLYFISVSLAHAFYFSLFCFIHFLYRVVGINTQSAP